MQCFPLWLINPIMCRRLCRIPDTGDFLKQVSRRSLWIRTAPASSEPLLSCLAKKGQCLCWLCYARQVGLEPRCPRFQHLYQRFTVMLWDSLIVLCFLCPPCCHFPLLGRRVSGILTRWPAYVSCAFLSTECECLGGQLERRLWCQGLYHAKWTSTVFY